MQRSQRALAENVTPVRLFTENAEQEKVPTTAMTRRERAHACTAPRINATCNGNNGNNRRRESDDGTAGHAGRGTDE